MRIKKIALVLTASIMILSSLSFSVFADDTTNPESTSAAETTEEEAYIISEDGTYKYSISTEESTEENSEDTEESGEEFAVLEEYLGSDENVVIPDEIDGLKVLKLGDYTFYEKTFIKSITISATLEDFGDFPFYGCTSITEFKVDEKNEIYTTDKDGSIVGRDGLAFFAYPIGKKPEEITVPDGYMAIKSSAFAMCSNLKKINLPESLEYIGTFAFAECTSLNNVVIPEKVTSIENCLFSGCSSLSEITLPNTIEKIGNASFFQCTSLMDFTFPTGLYSIGQGAFVSVGFKEIEIPDTITEIDYSAFGFTTDQSDQIIAVDNFVIKGFSGSYAQTYCSENGIEFVELKDDTTDAAQSDEKNSSKKIKPGIIVAICIAAAVIVIVVIAIVVRLSRGREDDDSDEEEDNDESREEIDEKTEDEDYGEENKGTENTDDD